MGIRTSSETKLLDAAEELFFTRGIAATPIDAVIARAGVSPATLYRGYASKEALVAAALDRRHAHWMAVWQQAVDLQTTPVERVLAVFDALDAFRDLPDAARWCAFLGSAAEYADPPPEIGVAVARDTDTLRSRLRGLVDELDRSDAARLVDELLLLVSGHLAMRLRDDSHSTATARAIAARLLADGPAVSSASAAGVAGADG